jgi:hypothetical protein
LGVKMERRDKGGRGVKDQKCKQTRTVVVGSGCGCIRLLQEAPRRDRDPASDDPYSLAAEQELMRCIESLLRPGTLACQ